MEATSVMPPDRLVIVISDLHMGVGALDDFDDEVERHFERFVDGLANDRRPVELVINGDLLDFVQSSPFTGRELEAEAADGTPLCFTEAQSSAKLSAIASQHAMAFDALARFVRGPAKWLTILPGNHDADFYWPSVRSAFTERLRGTNQAAADPVRFHLDPAYQPPGHEHLWIEHGHQHDPINAFVAGGAECWSAGRPPIFPSKAGEDRLYECIGTRFLIRYLNALDAEYPLVDNVKPFDRFLRIFGASFVATRNGPAKVAAAIATMARYLADRLVRRPSDLLGLEEGGAAAPGVDADLDAVLAHAIAVALPEQRRAFAAALARAGLDRDPQVMLDNPRTARELAEFIALNPSVLDPLDQIAPDGLMELGRGFRADDTDDLRRAAERVLDAPHAGAVRPQFVTMGHTHERIPGNRYLNTGCWTRYFTYVPGEPLNPWQMLREGSYARFPYTLTFLRSEASADPAVSLHAFACRDKD
jgi:metallophosphoesterase superfamily enzyme